MSPIEIMDLIDHLVGRNLIRVSASATDVEIIVCVEKYLEAQE